MNVYKTKKYFRPLLQNKQKGVIMFLTIVVLAVLLSIGLAITTILMGEIRIIRSIGKSVVAFYAADTGIEKVLLGQVNPQPVPLGPYINYGSFSAEYKVDVEYAGSDCTANTFCLFSYGTFQGVTRAIEVKR